MSGREIDAELLERWALGYLGRYASSAENLRRVLIRRARRRAILASDLKCRSVNNYAVLLTPQKNGNGPFTIPETFLRQA